jgi:type VI protein secretion system component Hcp
MPLVRPVRPRLLAVSAAATLALVASAPPALAGTSNTDLTITTYVDKASPNLMKTCSSGAHLPEAKL